MTTTAFLVVLLAAALHAGWNALVKGSDDKLLGMAAIAGAAIGIAALVLPVVQPPAPASWPFLAASALVHVAYFALIAASYRVADMSQAYPLMRGTAPLIVALVRAVVLGERLHAIAVVGVVTLCGGVLAMASGVRRGGGAGLALANAVVIATYTLLDGEGVRRSGAPIAYVLWVFALSGLPFAGAVTIARPRLVATYVRRRWAVAVVGGSATIGAYVLVLWAMTQAPIAIVAALRETAVLFGLAISATILDERIGRARLVQAGMIAAGVVLLRIA